MILEQISTGYMTLSMVTDDCISLARICQAAGLSLDAPAQAPLAQLAETYRAAFTALAVAARCTMLMFTCLTQTSK